MSTYNMNSMMTNREMALAMFVLPFQAAGRVIARMFSDTSRMTALDELNAMSDDDLAKRGVSRAEAVQQLLRCQY